MKYCRNCGKETTAKICPHCGNNSRKAQNYCGWCGNEVDKNAVMCPNCHEKLREGFGAKIGKFVGVLAAILLFILAVGFVQEGAVVSAVLFTLTGILLLPFVKSTIKKITFGNKGKRKIFSIFRAVAIVVVLVGGFVTLPEAEPIKNEVYKEAATEAALEVFHDEVTLKNEQSFVLNDSIVTYETPYNDNENLALVTVILDYSAQNGFGGTNRDTYTVKLIFRYSDGSYRPAN